MVGSRTPPWAFAAAGTLLLSLLVSGCVSLAGRLGEFDFRDRKLAVVTTAPPSPEVFTEDFWDSEERGWFRTLLRIGSEIARDVQANRAREKMEAAAQNVDVSALVADRALEQGARILRARPVGSVQEADFELEVRVKHYGIRANSWDAHADFFVDAEVFLFDSDTGDRIWKAGVDVREPINPSRWGWGGTAGNLITAQSLARLSVEEIERALEELAQFTADRVADRLAHGLEEARRR